MPTATVTSKGQITIPIEIRNELGLKPGDRVVFFKNFFGGYSLTAKNRSIQELCGILHRPGQHVTIEEMNDAIAEGAIESGLGIHREEVGAD
jgi:AbrB family looped-hinge helix DNA binding protein